MKDKHKRYRSADLGQSKDQKKMFVGDALIGKVSGKLNMLPPDKFLDINEARKSLQILRNFNFDDFRSSQELVHFFCISDSSQQQCAIMRRKRRI